MSIPNKWTIKKTLSGIIKGHGQITSKGPADLWELWPEAVGKEIAARALPISLYKGVLDLAVESTAWANELNMMREDLIAHINHEIPALKVTEIRIQIRRLPKRKPRETEAWKKASISKDQKAKIAVSVSKVDDKKLRKTLERFLQKQAKWQNHLDGKGPLDKKNIDK